MKNIIIGLLVVVLIIFGGYWLIQKLSEGPAIAPAPSVTTDTFPPPSGGPAAEPLIPETSPPVDSGETVIGKSIEGREIVAYRYGAGEKKILFIGGVHGGYSWNTALLAYELMDYLEEDPDIIPDQVEITVIPALNPDGLNKVVGTAGRFTKANVSSSTVVRTAGRFNANNVDLNRNFDCDWQTVGKWQNKTVSGGSEAFSEPESLALKNYIETLKPNAVVAWYSAAGGVFSSNCHNGILLETRTIANIYAQASGYPAYENFDFYKITGDLVNWLADNNIPAISVLLSSHENVEWVKNLAGIKALLEYYVK